MVGWLAVGGPTLCARWDNQYFVHILSLVTDKNPSLINGREENGGRNYNHFMINLQYGRRAGIKLGTPGSAVRHVSAVRCVTNCAMQPVVECLTQDQGYAGLSLTSVTTVCPRHN